MKLRTCLIQLFGLCIVSPIKAQISTLSQKTLAIQYSEKTVLPLLIHRGDTITNCKLINVNVNGPVDFSHSYIVNAGEFQGATFLGKAVFLLTDFVGTAFFFNTNFLAKTDFSYSKFSSVADFDNTKFNDAVDFHSVKFNDLSTFWNTQFLKEVNFSGSTFSQFASFKSINIPKEIYFNNSNFKQTIDFQNIIFKESVNFKNAVFDGEVFFENITFKKKLNFSEASFSRPLSLSRTQLPDTLFFDSVDLQRLQTNIFFNLAQLDTLRKTYNDPQKKVNINLYHTDLSKLVLDYDKFSLWFSEGISLEEKIVTYQQVIKKCADMGQESSAQGYDIDLQIMKIKERWGITSPIVIAFQQYWWNFGYERDKILRNTLYAFLFSLIIFLIGFKRFAATYLPAEQLGLNSVESLKLLKYQLDPTLKNDRFKIVFYYTALIFFGWKLDHSKVNYRAYPLSAAIVYLVYIVGLVHLAYLASFVIAR